MLLAKKDKAGIDLNNEENDFLLAYVPDSEELEELNATFIMMARLQSVNSDTKAGPSYNSDFANEVNDSQTSFINDMFAKGDHEQCYPEQTEAIKPTYDYDQIDSNIIFDDPYINVQLEAEKTNKINKVVKEQGNDVMNCDAHSCVEIDNECSREEIERI
ncbi:hypothetical protein Tco_1408235 [Tanacetum coccineum]